MQKFIDLRTLSLQDKTYLEYIEADKNHYASMTTVVGLKSIDGIVLASDSQWTSDPIKNLAISKIFQINDSMGIGVSGIMTHISTLIQDLKKIDIKDSTTELELRKNVDDILNELFREHVVERSRQLGYQQVQDIFQVTGLLAVKLLNGDFILYKVRLCPPNPSVEKIENYDAIGTGALYAQLILRQQSRAPSIDGKMLSDAGIDYNRWVSMLTINEIKQFDTLTGGTTRVAIVDNNGFRELTREEVIDTYEAYRNAIADCLGSLVGIDKEQLKKLYPDP